MMEDFPSRLKLSFSYLVELVDMLFDKGSIEDLTLRCVDHNKLPHLRRTAVQAVMTLKEQEAEG